MNVKKGLQLFIISLATIFVSSFFVANVSIVSAQAAGNQNLLCQVFPFLSGIGGGSEGSGSFLCGTNTGDTTVNSISSLIRFGLSLVFIGIIAIAIFYIIKSAIKYIRSEGKEEQVKDAQKAIKSVFIGVGALFVGIIGLVIILLFFNSQQALQGGTDTPAGINNILNP